MAPPRSSRLRKRQRKKKSPSHWLYPTLLVSITVLIYLSSFIIDDSDLHSESGSLTNDRIKQCRESCTEVILSREDILSDSSTGALAFSAFDALFSIRESDDEKYSDASEDKHQENGTIGGNNVSHDKQTLTSQVGNYSDLSPRPTRLPSLIETLVGTLDVNEKLSSAPLRDSKNGRKKHNNQILTTSRGAERSTRFLKGKGDSVAMVAAAAAAALWSESESRRGRFRMKAINNEWESSLRWIASWGQQHGNKAKMYHPGSMSVSPSEQSLNRELQRKKRRKSMTKKADAHDVKNLSYDEYSVFSDMLKACVTQCTGNSGEEHVQHSGNAPTNISESRKEDGVYFNVREMILIIKSISSRVFFLSSLFPSSQVNMKLIKGIIGMILSSITMLFFRNVTDWWRHKTSLRLLLKEVTIEEKMSRGHQKKNSTNTVGKKSSGKKRRRRRRESRQFQRSRSLNVSKDQSDAHEDVSISSESSIESKPYQEGTVSKNDDTRSEDQVSKSYTSSTSSHVTSDLSREERIPIQDNVGKSKNLTDTTTRSKHFVKHRNSKRRNNIVTKSHRLASLAQKGSLHYHQIFCVGTGPKEGSTHTMDIPKAEQCVGSVMSHDCRSIPTDKQREEASRQLRQYQLAQTQEYIRSKPTMFSGNMNIQPPELVYPRANLNFENAEVLRRTSKQTFSKSMRNNKYESPIANEGTTAIYLDSKANPSLGPGTFVGRSLLNMLDEDDEELQQSKTTSIFHSSSNHGKKAKDETLQSYSIALGGLLTLQGNTTKAVTSNPWCSESIESADGSPKPQVASGTQSPTLSIADSCSQSNNQDECNDANICLRGSAREFSPSWDSSRFRRNGGVLW